MAFDFAAIVKPGESSKEEMEKVPLEGKTDTDAYELLKLTLNSLFTGGDSKDRCKDFVKAVKLVMDHASGLEEMDEENPEADEESGEEDY